MPLSLRLNKRSQAVLRGRIDFQLHVVLLDAKKDPSVAAKQSPCCKRFTSMSRISEKIFSTRKH
ncbi:MAG: hypothetical protein DMG50_05920 [Acidobacteria bacterium]|nr:MAG: hypothetical protein DMG50_05920 [Acidobacteriota bacterium]